jgi:uncharacterized protein (TIGR02588 family)
VARRRRQAHEVPTIEWITGLAGLAIVLATLGFIGYEAFRGGAPSPRLEAAVETTGAVPSGFSATVAVLNASHQAAAEVVIEGVVQSGGGESRSQARLDYVPGRSTRRATLVFPGAPDAGGVKVRIVGYTTP